MKLLAAVLIIVFSAIAAPDLRAQQDCTLESAEDMKRILQATGDIEIIAEREKLEA
jgi:hypothetical protein